LLPQPASKRLVAATRLPAARADLLIEERRGRRMNSLSLCQQRTSDDGRRQERKS
jgi:hypothetical protein